MAAAIGILGWLLLHALGQNGRLLFRIEALESVVLGGEGFEVDEEAAVAGTVLDALRDVPVIHPGNRDVLPQPVEEQDSQGEEYLFAETGRLENPDEYGRHFSHRPYSRKLTGMQVDGYAS